MKNAEEIEIQRNGTHFKKVKADKNSLEILESGDKDQQKQIIFTLTASAGFAKIQSNPLNVIVKEPVFPLPIINYFKSNKHVLRNEGSFTLNWDVQNATGIVLLKDGMFCKEINIKEKGVEFNESYEGKRITIEYKLQATNDSGEINSNPIFISIRQPIKLVRIIVLICLIFILSFILYYKSHINKGEANTLSNEATTIDTLKNTVTTSPTKDSPKVSSSGNLPTQHDSVIVKPPKDPTIIQNSSVTQFTAAYVQEGETITINIKNFPKNNSTISVMFNDMIVKGKLHIVENF